MSESKHPLLKEPQPVFLGGVLCLVMLLMQFYVIQISAKGELVGYFNNPAVLFSVIMTGDFVNPIVWLIQTAAPLAMLLMAIIIGKKRAVLLVIPSAMPAVFSVVSIINIQDFNAYWLSYLVYILTAIIYVITATGVIKSVKPLIAYCAVVCLGAIALSALDLPPFNLFDGSLFLSDLVYFVFYHLAVINFAKAIPIQRKSMTVHS